MKYELIHDTIAKQVFEKASTEAHTRRKVEKFVKDRYEAYQSRGASLSQDDIDYLKPHLGKIRLSREEKDFIEKGQKALKTKQLRFRLIIAAIFLILLSSTALAFWQWKNANTEKKNAEEQKEIAELNAQKAITAQKADSLKSIELQRALKVAEAARDTAETNSIKAELARLEANRQARKAEKQQSLAEKNAAESQALALVSVAKDLPLSELETSLRILEKAYELSYPEAAPPLLQKALADKFYQQLITYPSTDSYPLSSWFSHEHEVKGYALSPDESHILTFGDDSLIKVWTIEGELIHSFNKHTDDIASAIFSPDGKHVLSSSFDEQAKLWNFKGEVLADMLMIGDRERLRSRKHQALISPDGNHILTQVSDTLKLWDRSGQKTADLYGEDAQALRQHILSQDNKGFYVWDYRGKQKSSILYKGRVKAYSISPDESLLIFSTDQKDIELWTMEGEHIPLAPIFADSLTEKRFASISTLLFSPDSKYVLLGLNRGLYLNSYAILNREGRLIKNFSSQLANFDKDSALIISSFTKDGEVFIQKIDMEGHIKKEFPITPKDFKSTYKYHAVSLDPEKRVLYLEPHLEKSFLWRFSGDKEEKPSIRIDFSNESFPSSKNFKIYNEPITTILDYTRGENKATDQSLVALSNPREISPGFYISSQHGIESPYHLYGEFIQFTSSARILTKTDKAYRLYNSQGFLRKRKAGFNEAFPDGRLLVRKKKEEKEIKGAEFNNSRYFYDIYTENEKFLRRVITPWKTDIGDIGLIYSATQNIIYERDGFSKNVYELSGEKRSFINSTIGGSNFLEKTDRVLIQNSFDTLAHIWDYKKEKTYILSHDEPIEGIIVSPDQTYFASFERKGGKFKVWDWEANLLFEENINTSRIGSIEFSPDSKSLLVRSYDRYVRRWNLNGKLLNEWGPFPDFIRSATFSPDGKEILINHGHHVLLYSLSGEEIASYRNKREIFDAGYSPKGRYLWLSLENQEILIQNREGEQITRIKGKSPFFSPLESMILTQPSGVNEANMLWNIRGTQIDSFPSFVGDIYPRPRIFLEFAPNGKSYTIAVNSRQEDERIEVHDTEGKLISVIPGSREGYKAYTQDSHFIWTQSRDTSINFWPLPDRIFKFLQEEAHFPLLTEEQKKLYGIN